MALTFREWLKGHFDAMISVRSSTLEGPADLVISSWTGMKLYLYLIDTPVKPRALRRVLSDNSSNGISTIFLMDQRIIPADGKRVDSPEWLQGLQALNGERFYAYGVDQHGVGIFPIHIEPVMGNEGGFEFWHGPRLSLERLRFYRSSVKLRSLKGDWPTADFGDKPFWRSDAYRVHRERKRETARKHRTTRWQTWSDFGNTWDGAQSASQHPGNPIEEHLAVCYRVLGVDHTATRDEIKSAFRRRALELHPDTSHLPVDEARIRFHNLNAAYTYIKSARGWT